MDWKNFEKILENYAEKVGAEISEAKVVAIGNKVEIRTFSDQLGNNFEFRISKPITEYGSRVKIESLSKEGYFRIKSKSSWLFKTKLKFEKYSPSFEIVDRLKQLQAIMPDFSWINTEKLVFKSRSLPQNIETIELIVDIHERIMRETKNWTEL